MNKHADMFVFLLRISLGWLFFYAGITKVINPEWSAGGFLRGANTFSGFYGWLASDAMLPFVNFLNEWGLTLIGVSLILGAFIRLSAPLGALMMLLYYIPRLVGFMPNEHSFIVDEHIIYALVFLVLAALHAGRTWGLDKRISQNPSLTRFT